MVAPRSILVPYDFTGPSKRACDYATELASAMGSKLCLVHVLERFGIPLSSDDHASLLMTVESELERAAALIRPSVPGVETCVVEGSAWEGIEAAARDNHAELIVMGTHGRRGLARALLGSVAARALRSSIVPVTTVPEYVAVSRNAAGTRLAGARELHALQNPSVIALSRGALTVATSLAEEVGGTVLYDACALDIGERSEDAVASARRRLTSEVVGLKEARSIGEVWGKDVVLVADGLFSAAFAKVAIAAIRAQGPRRIVLATPVIARDLLKVLEKDVDGIVTLDSALVTDACVYRDDVVPSDVVACEIILAPHAHAAS